MLKKTIGAKLLATVAVLGVLAAVGSVAVFSAFSSTTSNTGNSFATGSITLTDNDSASAMFTLTGLKGGDTSSKCIKVNYASTGSVNSTVKLYGATAGSGLADYLDVVVTKGTFPGAPPASFGCAGFSAGGAGSTLHTGTLTAYPDNFAGGYTDPDASWSNGESAVYKIDVTVQSVAGAQGKTATQDFIWEANSI